MVRDDDSMKKKILPLRWNLTRAFSVQRPPLNADGAGRPRAALAFCFTTFLVRSQLRGGVVGQLVSRSVGRSPVG